MVGKYITQREIQIQMLQKLRERMHSRQVYNQSVCNCHEDSELVRGFNDCEDEHDEYE